MERIIWKAGLGRKLSNINYRSSTNGQGRDVLSSRSRSNSHCPRNCKISGKLKILGKYSTSDGFCYLNFAHDILWLVYSIMQGFMDSFHFSGNIQNKYRQIGNAVPPPLAYALGTKLKEAVDAKKSKSAEA